MSYFVHLCFPVLIFLAGTSNVDFLNNSYNKKRSIASSDRNREDAIVGRWMTIEKSLEIEIYKQGNNFRAKIIWFKIEDTTRPMNTRMDEKNPNPALRHRKWLGMEVLNSLTYNPNDNEWQDGIIYDPKHGREWDSVAWLTGTGLLKVKGYWVFKWISETLVFGKL